MIRQYIQSNQSRFLSELFDLLRIPSVSADSKHKGDVRQAALFIEQIQGDYWNVVGLPINLVYNLYKKLPRRAVVFSH